MSAPSIAKTEALTLRVTPFSNTSQIVTWLTPDYGKIATIIKGAYRPKQDSANQYDIGYRCELLFYAVSHNGLHHFKECTALDARRRCRGDWRRTAAVSYLCRLAADAHPDGPHMPELYHLTDNAITALMQTPPPHDTLILWYELQLLELLGISPRLRHCSVCKEHLAPESGGHFAAARGGMVCEGCTPQRYEPDAVELSAETLALLRRWQRTANFAPLSTVALDSATRTALCQSLRHFLSRHLDTAPDCRAIALQMATLQLQPS